MTTTTDVCPDQYYDTSLRAWVERRHNPGRPCPRTPRRWELREESPGVTVGELAWAAVLLIGAAVIAVVCVAGLAFVAAMAWGWATRGPWV